LRPYQEAIVAICISTSTLVVLPTGLGKTMIALFVAAYRLGKIKKGKILLLAPTKPLVQQHLKTFKKDINLPEEDFALLTGEENAAKRQKAWQKARLIFATPQCIENDLVARKISLDDVSLLVYDEAHRATGAYAYNTIAKFYKTSKNPLSLALTASPGSEEAKIREVVENLNLEAMEIRSEKDEDVKGHVEKLDAEWVRIKFPENFKRLKELIGNVVREYISVLKDAGLLQGKNFSNLKKRDLLNLQSELRKAVAEGESYFAEISTAAGMIKAWHALELMETQGVEPLHEYFKRLQKQKSKAAFRLMKNESFQKAIHLTELLKSQGIEHPKLDKVKVVVAENLTRNKDSRVIIFTQYRDTVTKIVENLKAVESARAIEFVGQAAKGNKKGMTQKRQKEVLEQFRKGEFNVLVATSVGEEGLDIPEVDLVIFYEPVPSEIRSIQRRGRTARKTRGKMIVLVTEGTVDDAYFWAAYHKERRMKRTLKKLKTEYERGAEKVKQRAIGDFIQPDKDSGDIVVYVDQRERNSGITLKLAEMGARIEVKQLQVADYLVSNSVAVERKTISDFLQSMIDKRLMTQAHELTQNFDTPIMMVEGNNDGLYTMRNIHPNAVRGAMSAIAVNFGIPIIFTQDAEDTAAMLYTIAKREQEGITKEVALRGEKRAMSLKERQRFIVESLPNVSAVLAKRLLEKFGSVKKVMSATEKQLQKVEMIGEEKAKKIVEAARSKYEA